MNDLFELLTFHLFNSFSGIVVDCLGDPGNEGEKFRTKLFVSVLFIYAIRRWKENGS